MSDIETIKIGDRYQIKQQLSQKAGRQTLLARDAQSQELVIIKLLQLDNFFGWDDLKLFEREAQTLKNLNRPEIPQYLDYFEIDNDRVCGFFKGNSYAYALVQTYIDAPSLEAVIQQGRKFTEVELIELAAKLLTILDYLHSHNPPIIHRDIKPSNILISNRSGNSIGELYLVDFGSVQTKVSKDDGTITIVGTYGYIPFEQFSGRATAASDLYSLGMTLIYLITGNHPAELPLIDGRVKFEANISGRFNRWLEKMTHPLVNMRFDSAKSARMALLSSDGSSGDFLHLKPVNSGIKLERDRHKLNIFYPETKPRTSSCFIVSILTIIGIYMFGAEFLFIGLFFVLPISSVLISMLPTKFCYGTISITRNEAIQTGYCDKSFQNIEWHKTYDGYQKINLVSYNPGYTFNKYINDKGKEIRGGKVEVKPKLSVHLGAMEYSIGDDRFSQAELWWLGKEIGDFLGLELQVIYPTPKAPPEFSCGGGC